MAFYHSLGIKVSSLNMTLHCAFVGEDDVVSMLDFLVVFLVVYSHTKPRTMSLEVLGEKMPFLSIHVFFVQRNVRKHSLYTL